MSPARLPTRSASRVTGVSPVERAAATLALLLTLANQTPSRAQTKPTPPPPPAALQTATAWYRSALPSLTDQDIPRLYRAHQLIEEYFTDPSPDRRTSLLRELDRLNTTPREAALLSRLRLGWQPTVPGVYYINAAVGPYPVHYFVAIPNGYTPDAPRPLILMLPTATAFVVKRSMTEQDVADTYAAWLRDELAKRPGNIVVMPLLHMTDLWGPGYAGMNNAIKPLQDATDRFNIDPRRVYLRGQGMSGHAVWNLGLHYPTYFAAINPLAGGASADWQKMRIINLRNTLPVIWHDASDETVPVKLSRDLVALLKRNKIDYAYDETKSLGHVPSPEVDQKLCDTMLARARDLYPKSISLRTNRPDTAFNRIDWIQAWEPLDGGQESREVFQFSGTGMWTYQYPLTLDATIKDNAIDITQRNLATARILLSPDMVDFARPVKVTVNNKPIFNALVKESVESVLKDQLLLGRGWRGFTAEINLDLIPSVTSRPTTRSSTRR